MMKRVEGDVVERRFYLGRKEDIEADRVEIVPASEGWCGGRESRWVDYESRMRTR